ncbi:hypothetical protein RJ639_015596 [Escallonia herrerae]|uniref:Fe2OG dioxygenase domain-containing protein n=1 Tax=Escallonia herrerae TaxID=1293975 RepID=A0AA88VFG7_9ASTE|nr:hypothetical protein RJ639_015596 [Escallonia herrerae]
MDVIFLLSRQTISSMIEQLDELNSLIEKSILDSFGLGDKIESIMPSKTLLRVQRYKAPPNGDYLNGLDAHTDKLLSAILCADQVFGLEVQTKDGQWHKLSPSPNSFIFIVGDPLMAWSNGRLHSAKHRVMMKGHEERFSLAAFPAPVEGTVIRPQKELVDEEHPQFYKEFDYMDFLKFSLSKDGMAIDALATYKLL